MLPTKATNFSPAGGKKVKQLRWDIIRKSVIKKCFNNRMKKERQEGSKGATTHV